MIKESKVTNNKNKHEYIQAAVNIMFTQIHKKKGIKLFGESYIYSMIK